MKHIFCVEFIYSESFVLKKNDTMEQITDFFEKLFSTADWPARWSCGTWTEFHGWLYVMSDIAIWAAYFVIPILLILFIKKKPSLPLPTVFWLFGAFILFCGLTHLLDALIFWWPAYRLSAILRLVTAVISWITVVAVYKYLPVALSLKTVKDFEAELLDRKKSESKFVNLLESAPDAKVIADINGIIQMVNAQTERIFGYQRDEIIGKTVEILIPEWFHNKQIGHRQEYGIELLGKRKDGSEFPVEVSLSPMKLADEEGILVISAIRDITSRKKAEAKFIGVVESAPDAMVIAGSDGKIQMVNAQTENLFGYHRDEIIGKEVEILIPERFHNNHTGHRNGYIEHPKVREMGVGMELFGKRKDGSEFPVEISLSPMKLIGEEGILVISRIRDITKQKETEAEIRKLNENLELLIVERTTELQVALKKEKAARIEMNQNQLRLTFLTKASNILASSLDYSETLKNVARMVTPEIADWCAIDEVEENGVLKRIVVSHVDPKKIEYAFELEQKYPTDPSAPQGIYEVMRTHKPELYANIPDEILVTVAKDQEHLRIIRELGLKSAIIVPLISRDKIFGVLTLILSDSGRLFDENDLEFANELARRATLAIENAKLYKKMQDSNAELEHRVIQRTAELEAINKELEAFSYSVSHDLRAPLRSIDGFSNKILKDYNDLLGEQGKDYFNRVMNASRHMGHLIDDLIKLARISRIDMNMEEVNLSVIAQSIVGELKESNPERVVSIYIQDNMIVNGDRNLMHVAINNLLGNAWKYSKNKAETKIEFSTIQKDGQIIYFIRDNGAGFDMRYVDKLFGAFQRLHSLSEFEGTGIGLATVQRIIRRHQGTIWAESEVDKGTTFFFTL